MDRPSQVAVIILAAGESKRLSQPKQLLQYLGNTLICHVVESALASKAGRTIVVTGAHEKRLRDELDRFEVIISQNVAWREGVHTSICHGIETLERFGKHDTAALIMTSDQPHVSTRLIDSIIDAYDLRADRIVACAYEETIGVPALFGRSYFPELKSLSGDSGAKGIIMENRDKVISVPFPEGGLDIDNLRDLEQLRQSKPES